MLRTVGGFGWSRMGEPPESMRKTSVGLSPLSIAWNCC